MQEYKVILAGYGNVGQAFEKMLERKMAFIEKEYDATVKIVGIATKSRGVKMPGKSDFDKNISTMELIQKTDYDIMVEVTPINIMTGQPAIDHIEAAISRGKHVITANKGPIAWKYDEISALAKEKGVQFLFESTVMDGAPVFDMHKYTLKGCKVVGIKGIVNSTTNFILDRMSEGAGWDEALEEGRAQGFVEADPTMDTDGWDASAKLCALMNVLMRAKINPTQVSRTGISGVSFEDLQNAKAQNKAIKLMCYGYLENGVPKARVAPEPVDKDSIYATIKGTGSVVTIDTDLMGEISMVQHEFEPEIDKTAYGVFGDLIRIIESEKLNSVF